MGIRDAQTGSVAMIERFGGIANLDPHFHSVLPDRLFVSAPDGPMGFVPLPPPTDQDIQDLTTRLAKRLGDIARKRFEQAEDQPPWPGDEQAPVYRPCPSRWARPPQARPFRGFAWETGPRARALRGCTVRNRPPVGCGTGLSARSASPAFRWHPGANEKT